MSVLIKGMKMPICCRDCACYKHKSDPGYYDYDTCGALKNVFNETKLDIDPFSGRLDNCPLVEVPTPHGRLIDASTKIEAQLYDEMTEEWNLRTMTVDDYLAFAADIPSTIIEAEEGEEDD